MDSPSTSTGRVWAQRYRTKLRITDISIIVCVVTLALVVWLGSQALTGRLPAGAAVPLNYWMVPLVVTTAWIVTLGVFHTRDSRIIEVGAAEYKYVIHASIVTFGLLATAFLIFQINGARAYFFLALPIGVTALTLARWLWRGWLLHQRKFGHYLARAIVVGKPRRHSHRQSGGSLLIDIATTADVDPSAVIVPGSQVWHLAQVREYARLGPGCILGRNCKVQNYALVYEPALLEDGVFVGPGAVFTNDLAPRAVNPDGTRKGSDDWRMVGVTVRTGASIGARAVCIAPLTIGRWAMVGAGAVVTRDVPEYALVAGVPARRIGWVGRSGIGLRDEGGHRFVCTSRTADCSRAAVRA